MMLLDKLQALEDKYRELESLLSDPETVQDIARWQALSKEHAQLAPIAASVREYRQVLRDAAEARELAQGNDPEMKELAAQELAELTVRQEELEKELPLLLLPRDPNDDKNVIVEIRGGVGGEEAALFAGDLFRMYARYAEKRGWKAEILDANATEIGGYKEISFLVNGTGAYSRLKYESGTHRVQRVPVTESGGRIHTSAATVAVGGSAAGNGGGGGIGRPEGSAH